MPTYRLANDQGDSMSSRNDNNGDIKGGLNNTNTWVWNGYSHFNTSYDSTTGFRFDLPAEVINATVSAATISFTNANTGTFRSAITVESNADQFQNTSSPQSRYAAAVTAGSEKALYSEAAGSTYTTQDFAQQMEDAFADCTDGGGAASSGYVSVAVLIRGDNGGNTGVQTYGGNYGTESSRPLLSVTYTAGPQTRWLDSTASGSSSATGGEELVPTEVILRFDGTGTSDGTDFTGSQGFNSTDSPLVTSGSLQAANGQFSRIVRWIDATTQYNEPDRRLYCNQTGVSSGYNYAEFDLTGIASGKFNNGIRLHFWVSYGTVGAGSGDFFEIHNASGDVLVKLYNYQSETTSRTVINNGNAGTGLTGGLNRWEIYSTGTGSTDTWRLKGFAGNSTTATYDSGDLTMGTTANGMVPATIRIGNCDNVSLQPNRYYQDLYITTNGFLGEIGNYTPESFVTGTAAGDSVASGAPVPIKYIPTSTAHGAARVIGTVTKPGEILIPTAGDTVAAGASSVSGPLVLSHNMGDGQGVIAGSSIASGAVFAGVVYTDISYDYDVTFGDVRRDTSAGDTNRHPDRRLLDIWLPSEQTHGPGPYPTFVWVHGGSFERGGKQDVDDPDGSQGQPYEMYQALLDEGWAVVSPNYRFKDGFGPNANYIQHPDSVDDLKLAISFLVNNADFYGLDMAKWAMGGHSAGGYLALWAGLTNSMADQSAVPYYQQYPTAGVTTRDYDVGARYTGGYATHTPKPLGIAVWEAPVALRWSAQEEPNILGQDAYSLDNVIREYLAASSHTPGSFTDISVAVDDTVSVANATMTDGSNIVTEDAPRLFYAYSQTTTNDIDWATITFLPTYNSPSTAGNGYYLKQAANTAGVPFEEHRASGANHETINGFKSVEFISWLNETVEAAMFSEAAGSSAASGDLTVSKVINGSPAAGDSFAGGSPTTQSLIKWIAYSYGGTYGYGYAISLTRGTSVASGAPETLRYITGSASGSSVASGVPTLTKGLSGTAAGSSVASGQPYVTKHLGSVATGASVSSGDLLITKHLGSTAAGASVASGSLSLTKYLDSTAAGLGRVVGVPSNSNVKFIPPADDTIAGGSSIASGTLSVGRAIAGTATGSALASGEPSTSNVKWLDSSSSGNSQTSGTVTPTRWLTVSSAAGASVATGAPAIVTTKYVTGTAAGSSATAGAPETVTTTYLTGTSAGSSVASGAPDAVAVGTDKNITGTARGVGAASGAPTVTNFLTGTAAGSSAASGEPSQITNKLVTGSAEGQSVASGDLTVIKLISAPIRGVSVTSGGPTVTGFIPVSTAAGASAASGFPSVGHAISGTAAGAALVSGVLTTQTLAYWAVKNGQVYPAKISAWIDSTGTLHVGTDGLKYLGVVGTDL